MAKMTPEELTKTLPFEAAGKVPFDPGRAVLRHTIVGEVYQNQEAKQEVILMAAPREAVDRHLNVLSKARLEVVGIHVEPTALIECFAQLFRRKGDENISTLFIDMGAGATHVVIAHGRNMVFAKHLSVGGDHFNRRVAEALKTDLASAKQTRIQVSHQQAQTVRLPAGVVGIGAGGKDGQTHPLGQQNASKEEPLVKASVVEQVHQALAEPLETLIGDLQLCVRYYESIFPGGKLDRAIFVGGESRHVAICQSIAQRWGYRRRWAIRWRACKRILSPRRRSICVSRNPDGRLRWVWASGFRPRRSNERHEEVPMSQSPNTMNFLPDDYVEKREATRSAVIFVGLLLLVVGGIVGTYLFKKWQAGEVFIHQAKVEAQFEDAEKRIAEADEIDQQKATMVAKAELATTLMERGSAEPAAAPVDRVAAAVGAHGQPGSSRPRISRMRARRRR